MIRNRGLIWVARIEMVRLINHPVTLITCIILVALAMVNALGSIYTMPSFESWMTGDDVFIKVGLSQQWYMISLYCSIAALVLGVLSIAEDRPRTLGVLLTKPVGPREVVAGKFLGVSAFMLLIITVTYLLVCLLLTLAFRGPLSLQELALRLSALILTLFLECSLLAGIGMFIGLVSNGLKDAIIITITYMFIEYFSDGMFWRVLSFSSLLHPYYVYNRTIIAADGVNLVDTSIPFGHWLGTAFPYIALILLGIAVIFIVDTRIFMKHATR
jgi:ABC-2 type transport system permease protein